MNQVGPYLRKTEHGYMHWCPGCKQLHHINVEVPHTNGAVWKFNGDLNKPAFNPSVNHLTPKVDGNGDPIQPYQWEPLCHYFIREGRIEFCGDSKHALRGQTVALPPLPLHCRDDWNEPTEDENNG